MAKAQFVNELRGEAKKEARKALENTKDLFEILAVEVLVQSDRILVKAINGLNDVHKRLLKKIQEELPKNKKHLKAQVQAQAQTEA